MITERQLLTLQHLKDMGITTAEQILNFLNERMKDKRHGIHRRRHSKKYYQELIKYINSKYN